MLIKHADINITYEPFLKQYESLNLFNELENVEYLDSNISKVCIYNKWHPIPRKHIAFGDESINYTFSKTTVKSMPWLHCLAKAKYKLEEKLKCRFNFALVNKYADGNDYMGEHRDNERNLDPTSPIASLSLGQDRPFLFRHISLVRKNYVYGSSSRHIISQGPVADMPKRYEVILRNGSLLTMYPPTNDYWYHSLPKRKMLKGVRINVTFRKIMV